MKKVILKSTLAVVAVAASCLGAWKAYNAYERVDNSMVIENIEALCDDFGDGSTGLVEIPAYLNMRYKKGVNTDWIYYSRNQCGPKQDTEGYGEKKNCLVSKN